MTSRNHAVICTKCVSLQSVKPRTQKLINLWVLVFGSEIKLPPFLYTGSEGKDRGEELFEQLVFLCIGSCYLKKFLKIFVIIYRSWSGDDLVMIVRIVPTFFLSYATNQRGLSPDRPSALNHTRDLIYRTWSLRWCSPFPTKRSRFVVL